MIELITSNLNDGFFAFKNNAVYHHLFDVVLEEHDLLFSVVLLTKLLLRFLAHDPLARS